MACQRSSGVEQRFRKPPVVGSNPTAGSFSPYIRAFNRENRGFLKSP